MKIKGSSIKPPKPFDIIIPRKGEENIHLKVQAVLDFAPFDKVLPEPQAPISRKVGEETGKPNYKDKAFVQAWDDWWDKRQGWMSIKSLEATEGLELTSGNSADPSSCSFRALAKELTETFLAPEVTYILKQIRQANAMDESHIEEARNRFLLQAAERSE